MVTHEAKYKVIPVVDCVLEVSSVVSICAVVHCKPWNVGAVGKDGAAITR